MELWAPSILLNCPSSCALASPKLKQYSHNWYSVVFLSSPFGNLIMPWLLKTHNSVERLSDSRPSRAALPDGLLKFSQAKSQLIRSEQRGASEGRTPRWTAVFSAWRKQSSVVGGGSSAVEKTKLMTQSDGGVSDVKTSLIISSDFTVSSWKWSQMFLWSFSSENLASTKERMLKKEVP